MTREELNAKYPCMANTELFQHDNGGGWVEHPERVEASAFVAGLVSGNAQVFGNAQVYGNAQVSGNAQISATPWMISLGRHTVVKCDGDVICIGCHVNTLAGWLDKYEAVGRMEGYTKEEIARYGAALKMIEQLTAVPVAA